MIDTKIAAMGHWMALLVEARLSRNPTGIIATAKQIEREAAAIRAYYEAHERGETNGKPAPTEG